MGQDMRWLNEYEDERRREEAWANLQKERDEWQSRALKAEEAVETARTIRKHTLDEVMAFTDGLMNAKLDQMHKDHPLVIIRVYIDRLRFAEKPIA